jgi:hypothetical protein
MLKFVTGFSVAFVLAAAFLPASAFSAVQVATPSSPLIVGKFEIRNADRGAVKRIKVFYDGTRIATITVRRGAASGHCCTPSACTPIEPPKACTSLRVACDADGWCSAG